MRGRRVLRGVLYVSGAGVVAATGSFLYTSIKPRTIPGSEPPVAPPPGYTKSGKLRPPRFPQLKLRDEQIEELKSSAVVRTDTSSSSWSNYFNSALDTVLLRQSSNVDGEEPEKAPEPYDILIIGGGATGAGIALDAATRGLRVAVIEKDDFASGTSSKSTKLVHGGVRYLEKAVWNLDYNQYALVVEALRERKYFLDTAPHLSQWLPTMIPLYSWWKVPYYWAGTKFYDFLAGSENIESSYFLTRSKALDAFPMLKKDDLVGALVYYDGQHNDSRMNVSLAVTAALYGATVVNHMEVTALQKDEHGRIKGVIAKDLIPQLNGKSPEPFPIAAKAVINATGPLTDSIRLMDDPSTKKIVAPSSGVHIVLPGYYSPASMGLIDPATSDGRVIFFLPWEGNTIAGTTDEPTDVTPRPIASEKDVDWILKEIRGYLSPDINVRRGDVLAAWSGIRPLVRNPEAKNTESLVRNHLVHISESGLLTIAGGKWTTYRQMAEEAVDAAIEEFGLKPKPVIDPPRISGTEVKDFVNALDGSCQTHQVKLLGAHGFSRTLFINLVQHFGLETTVAQHLTQYYGDRAWTVAALCAPTEIRYPVRGIRLSNLYPFVDGEVRYAVRHEYAQTAADVLARRIRLAFLNAQEAMEALPKVIDIMSVELGWDQKRQVREWKETVAFLESMGLPKKMLKLSRKDIEKARSVPYSEEEIGMYSRHDRPADELASDFESPPRPAPTYTS